MLNYQNLELYINYFMICSAGYFITVYIFCKSQSIKLSKSQKLFLIVFGVFLSILFTIVRKDSIPFSHLIRFLGIPLGMCCIIYKREQLFKSLVIGFVSIAFESICEILATLLQAVLLWTLNLVPNENVAYLFIVTITFALCAIFMNVKRFKRGFQFFQRDDKLGLGISLSGIVMIIKCINIREHRDTDYLYIVYILGCIIVGFGIYLWIRRSITAHYRERLQLKSEEHYKEVLEERDKEIEKLNQSNAYLAKIVHRDNHLMSNVNTSIDIYFNSNDEAYKETLLRELQTLAKERSETINKEQLESKLLPSTGNLLIDGAINDLYIKAAAHGIDFNLTVSSTVDEIIGKYISQTDLQTLLCDHIKDAIIAVDSYGESGGKILVNLSKLNDNYCIDIYDSGVAFETATLSKLGMDRVTTHADSGGSGIGFMTTFETIKKAYASLIITEFEHRSPFSKSVSFRFDGESVFIINSYRKDELQQLINRNDVIFL